MRVLSLNNFGYQSSFNRISPVKQVQSQESPEVSAKNYAYDPLAFRAKFPMKELCADNITRTVKEKRMNRIATIFLDVLESIAIEKKDKGIKFNKEYCKKAPIKSADAYISKMMRVDDFVVKDWIRATLFLENPYDLSILKDDILPALEERGYIPATVKVRLEDAVRKGHIPTQSEIKKGVVEMEDIDVRLNDALEHIEKTAPEFKKYAGNPQKSGYEDIQIHLVRDYDDAKPPLYHELLIIFGDNYAKAKEIESEKIYKIVREFSNLSALKSGEMNPQEEMLLKDYIKEIRENFTKQASEKLFKNAKKKDFYKMNEQAEISFSLKDEVEMNERFISMISIIDRHYRRKIRQIKGDDALKRSVSKNWRQDKALLEQTRVKLKDSMSYFNNDYGKETVKKTKKTKKVEE